MKYARRSRLITFSKMNVTMLLLRPNL